jgi:hypothetical protein
VNIAEHTESTVEFIRANGSGTSLVEIKRHLGQQGMETEGEVAVETGGCKNLFIWAGMSQEFADVLKAILCDRRVLATPTTALVYYCDGEALTLPVAQKPPKGGYKEPHWLPACFGYVRDARSGAAL